MAKETKSISVHPADEQETIEQYQAFGWELQSSQEIFEKDSHLERSGNNINQVTTTTNYVKLVFSRETTMPNYHQLTKLENQYHSVHFPYRKTAKVWFILSAIVAFFGFITLGTWFIGVPLLIGAITLFVFAIIKKKKFDDEYWNEYRLADEKCEEILNKAKQLDKDVPKV